MEINIKKSNHLLEIMDNLIRNKFLKGTIFLSFEIIDMFPMSMTLTELITYKKNVRSKIPPHNASLKNLNI